MYDFSSFGQQFDCYGNTLPRSSGLPNSPNQMRTNIIFVNGIEDVKNRYQNCNTRVLYSDNEKNIVYLKIVDDVGRFSIKTYNLVEAEQSDSAQSPYVTRKEFDDFVKSLNSPKKDIIPTGDNV